MKIPFPWTFLLLYYTIYSQLLWRLSIKSISIISIKHTLVGALIHFSRSARGDQGLGVWSRLLISFHFVVCIWQQPNQTLSHMITPTTVSLYYNTTILNYSLNRNGPGGIWCGGVPYSLLALENGIHWNCGTKWRLAQGWLNMALWMYRNCMAYHKHPNNVGFPEPIYSVAQKKWDPSGLMLTQEGPTFWATL